MTASVLAPLVTDIYISIIYKVKEPFPYTIRRQYRAVGNRYSQLLFTSEDLLCVNLHVQEQSKNMTSQS